MDEQELTKLGYKLLWADEFEGDELDRAIWNVEEHPSKWINEELQAFVDDGKHVYVSDGHLVIKPERIINPDKTAEYKSARITTEGKRDFTCGYIEVRARIAGGKGFLSAIRLLSSGNPYGDWPRSGSIDILAADGQYPERGSAIMHFGEPAEERSRSLGDGDTDLSADFHVYACEWLPGKMTFYFDGEPVFTNSYWFSSPEEGMPRSYPAPYDRPFHLEFDVSIGGNWVSAPDRATSFNEEAEFLIDYVRVYRKDEYDTNVVMPDIKKRFKEPDETGNYVSSDPKDWHFYNVCGGEGSFSVEDDEYCIDIINVGDRDHSIQLYQANLPVKTGRRYKLSFEAMAYEHRTMRAAVTAPDMHWKRYLEDVDVELVETWQKHSLFFEMHDEDDDNGRIEFNLGNLESAAKVKLRNIRFEEVPPAEDQRKGIAVCGSWEDAENYNLFIRSIMTPRFRRDYVLLSFTFGLADAGITDDQIGVEFAGFIERFEIAAIFVFAEMIRTPEILDKLVSIGKAKDIPVIFLEHQRKGVINAVLDYAGGFEKMVSHVLDHHKCRKVKFFAGSPDNAFSIERENIYRRLMLAHKLKVDKDDILYGGFWDATTQAELDSKLDAGMEVPEAFICANDSMAIGVCECLRKRGVRVPEDVIVTGFDGIWHGRYHYPAITTVAPDYTGLSDYVLDIVEGRKTIEKNKAIKYSVGYEEIIARSCGCGCSDVSHWGDIVNTVSDYNQDYFRHMLEMGKFVTATLSMDDVDEATESLNRYLWLWKEPYYFLGLTHGCGKNCVHSLLRGFGTDLHFKEKYYNLPDPFPEWNELMKRGSGADALMIRQLRTTGSNYGYMCCSAKEMNLREQQRFEEFGLFVSAMVSSVTDKTKLVEANRAISRLNEHDYLTNLYNRRGFFRCVDEMLTDPKNRGRIFSLFSVDMDGLKYINDHFGHQEGDNAIIILSKALLAYTGDRGICARYGGDEFAMAVVGDTNIADDYMEIRARIHGHAMRDPVVRELEYSINASIGIAECVISDDVDLEELIREADLRMYEDKQARKGSNEIR